MMTRTQIRLHIIHPDVLEQTDIKKEILSKDLLLLLKHLVLLKKISALDKTRRHIILRNSFAVFEELCIVVEKIHAEDIPDAKWSNFVPGSVFLFGL